MTVRIALQGLTHSFDGVRALDGADFTLRQGTVHALLGENGAGKTTLMRVAFGMLRPDAGRIVIDGVERRFASPADAMRAGLGMVHQHFALVPAMTVAENVALGGHGRFDIREAAERVRAIGAATGLVLDPMATAASLGVGAQQRLEIVKALARDARVLILDEPTAVLAPAEARELLEWVRGFADRGGAAVLITHKLREALGVADDVTVLRRGRTVLAAAAASVSESALAAAMLGTADGLVADRAGAPPRQQHARSPASGHHPVRASVGQSAPGNESTPAPSATAVTEAAAATGPAILRARDLVVHDERGVPRVKGISLDVHAGEIVGVAAVEGAGQRELLRALAGRAAPASGTLERPAVVGFVPEDRHRDGVVLDFTLTENVALREAGALRGWVAWRARARETAALLALHDVRAPGPAAPLRALSGGNQQKLVLARELAAAPRALVAENPTRGLDIRASAAVVARLRAARSAGVAIVVHAADLDDVLAIADRVVVLYDGRLRDVPRDREAIGRAMLGA